MTQPKPVNICPDWSDPRLELYVQDTGVQDLVQTNIQTLTLKLCQSEMKDMLVLLRCSGLMANNACIYFRHSGACVFVFIAS